MLLKDTYGVVQQSSRASDTTSGKLPKAITPFVFYSEASIPFVSDFGHQDHFMEEVVAKRVISETQQVEASVSQPYTGTSSQDIPNALRKTI